MKVKMPVTVEVSDKAPLVRSYVSAKVGDKNSRILSVGLINYGKFTEIPDNASVGLGYELPDVGVCISYGTVVMGRAEFDISAILSKPGNIPCEVCVTTPEDGAVLTSNLFEVRVYDSLIGAGTEPEPSVTDTNKAISPYAKTFGTDNLAGSRGFTIIALDPVGKTYTLDSVAGLEIGDVYSVHLYEQRENHGRIIAIDTAKNIVTVDVHFGTALNTTSTAIEADGFDNEKNTFRIISKPFVGTRKLGCAAITLGYNGKALSKGSLTSGFQNLSYGSYAATFGAENKAGYCAFAQGAYHNISGFWSAGFGKRCKISGKCSFGAGEGLDVAGDNQSVFGTYNIPVPEALLIAGNGTSDAERSNAFELYRDGRATLNGYNVLTVGNVEELLGTWALTPYIAGVTAALKVSLNFPVDYDAWGLVINGSNISGSVAAGSAYVTAPQLFDIEDVKIVFELDENVVLETDVIISREVGELKLGVLKLKEVAENE